VADVAVYEGHSAFLRWWPKALLLLAVLILVIGWTRSLQWAALFAFVAFLHGKLLPWRFTISVDGLRLTFPFGREIFIPKSATTVRLEQLGAVALVGSRRKMGYVLSDGVLYSPDKAPRLRRALSLCGYTVA
jgi:hypothetical protein